MGEFWGVDCLKRERSTISIQVLILLVTMKYKVHGSLALFLPMLRWGFTFVGDMTRA